MWSVVALTSPLPEPLSSKRYEALTHWHRHFVEMRPRARVGAGGRRRARDAPFRLRSVAGKARVHHPARAASWEGGWGGRGRTDRPDDPGAGTDPSAHEAPGDPDCRERATRIELAFSAWEASTVEARF